MFVACHNYPQLAQWLQLPSDGQFMVPHMVAIIVVFALIFTLPTPALADQCAEKACINVYTDNNQIIIEARKGNTSVKKSISQAPKKAAVKPTPKPTVKPLFFPPTTPKPIIKKPVIKRTNKPRVKRAPLRSISAIV
jgi:hypothetical protein